MIASKWLLAVLLICSLFFCPVSHAAVLAPTVYGKVFRKAGDNQIPVPGARLELKQGSEIKARAVSDTQGVYAFSRVPPGQYILSVTIGGTIKRNSPIAVGDQVQRIDDIVLD